MRALEDLLFKRWQSSLPEEQQRSFVTDGVVDADYYTTSSCKILFLLKEVNDPGDDGGGWCLREKLKTGDRPATWDSVTRWLRAIRNIREEISWHDLEYVTEAQRREELRSIAAMNLKKTPGSHTTEMPNWWRAVERDKQYLREQFEIYEADLVICCGSEVFNAFYAHIQPQGSSEYLYTFRGVKYIEYRNGKYVISYSHPAARVAPNLLHYGLVDAVREIFGRAPSHSIR